MLTAQPVSDRVLRSDQSLFGVVMTSDARKVHVNPNFAGAAAPVVHGAGAGAGVPPPKRPSDGRYDDPAKVCECNVCVCACGRICVIP